MGPQHAGEDFQRDDRRRCLGSLPGPCLLFRYHKLLKFCVAWKFICVAAAAIATIPFTIPFAKVTQDETTIAVLAKSTGETEHPPELLVLELAARFKLKKFGVRLDYASRFRK